MPKRLKKKSSRVKNDPRRLIVLLAIFACSVIFLCLAYKHAQDLGQEISDKSRAAIYSGTTPCADCSGIKTTLTLSENPNTYNLNLNYEGKNTSFTEQGTWTKSFWKTNPPKLVYTLISNSGNKTYYQVLSFTRIRQLDGEGNPIPDNMPFTLIRE